MSVVVPVYNAEATLAACLDSLMADVAAANGDIEVIVVDNGSGDASREIASRYNVRLITWPRRSGPAMARNLGAQRASGQIIVFVDADVVPRPRSLDALVRALDGNPRVAAVFGSYDDQPTALAVVSQFRNLLHHHMHQTGDHHAGTFWAGFGAVRREPFVRLGGFDRRYDDASIEDVDFGMRLVDGGLQVLLVPECQVTHAKRWTLRSMIAADFWWRGVPWTHLILRSHQCRSDLNLSWSQRISAVLACAALATLLWGAASNLLTALLVGAILLSLVVGDWIAEDATRGTGPSSSLQPPQHRAARWWINAIGVLVTGFTAALVINLASQHAALAMIVVAPLVAMVSLNARFYGLLARRLGIWQLMPAMWLHVAYFLNATLAMLYGLWTFARLPDEPTTSGEALDAIDVLDVLHGLDEDTLIDTSELTDSITNSPALDPLRSDADGDQDGQSRAEGDPLSAARNPSR